MLGRTLFFIITAAAALYAARGGSDISFIEKTSANRFVEEKLLYVTFQHIPEKIYLGEIFPVSLKITALHRHDPILIELKGGKGVKLIKSVKYLAPGSIHRITLYFQATDTNVQLPTFRFRYRKSRDYYDFKPPEIKVVALNPPADFSKLLAKNLTILNYQASAYDEKKNLLSLHLKIERGNAKEFHIPGALRDQIDKIEGDYNDTIIDYLALFPNFTDQVQFSYFNLDTNRYEKFRIPVMVRRNRLSTQTDLDPRAGEFTKFKIGVTIGFILLCTLLWYRRHKWLYVILILLAIAYLVTYLIPLKNVCIKKGAILYLLPTAQSTPFMYTQNRIDAKEMDRKEKYIKIELPNHRIGWVKNEDLCQN